MFYNEGNPLLGGICMSAKNLIELPKELEQYRSIVEEALKPVVWIDTDVRKTTLFESKFAGDPYFPLSMEYPKSSTDGQPLKLLAQINFAELPKHLSNFPEEGILQFYIDGYDDVLGMDFDNGQNQDGFRVIFHDTIVRDETQLIQDFSFIENKDEELYFPVEREMALAFKVGMEPLSIRDFRGREAYGAILKTLEGNSQVENAFYEALSSTGHKIGGYPFFTQEDPRAYDDYQDATILLLQIDSVGDDILWGDCGVGNFFITERELKNKDFSNVLYNWDCF